MQSQEANSATLGVIGAFLKAIALPSAFLFKTNDQILVAGTIKEAGMEEPISSYYFKHGEAGLGDINLIGIRERPATHFTQPNTDLITASRGVSQSLTDMLFPKDAIRMTPLA